MSAEGVGPDFYHQVPRKPLPNRTGAEYMQKWHEADKER